MTLKRLCLWCVLAALICPVIMAGLAMALLIYGPDLPDGWVF